MMRLNDVANQLRLLLPQYTDLFHENLSVSSITSDGSTVTVVTSSAHNLSTGRYVILSNVGYHNPITAKPTVDGLKYTFTTGGDHDLTENWFRVPSDPNTKNEVELGGFTDSNWNDVFTLLSVDNRRDFTVRSSETDPTLNGNEYLIEITSQGVNGAQQVTVVNSTTFTFSSAASAGTYSGGKVATMPRVLVGIDGNDVWRRVVTPEGTGDLTLAVLPLPVNTSKDRNERSDAVSARTRGNTLRLKILDGFALFIIVPTHEELSGGKAIDICRHDLRGPIYKCLYGATFDTGTENRADYKVIPVSDDVVTYNRAVLVYSYEFQVPVDLITEDSVPDSQTVAFRDIPYTLDVGDGMTSPIDLDDEPL